LLLVRPTSLTYFSTTNDKSIFEGGHSSQTFRSRSVSKDGP
jgi:hypothetical protein